MIVDYSKHLEKLFSTLTVSVQKGLFDFVKHVESNGLEGLSGLNKPSSEVGTNDRAYLAKVKYTTDNNLFHYHLGVPHYEKMKGFGFYTSEWVVHYMKINDNVIKCVHVNAHSRQQSFRNPSPSMLERLR